MACGALFFERTGPNGPVPPPGFEYGVSAPNGSYILVFGPNPNFTNLAPGLYRWAVRRADTQEIVQQGTQLITCNDYSFENDGYISDVLTGAVSVLPKALHGVEQVRQLTVRKYDAATDTEEEIEAEVKVNRATDEVRVEVGPGIGAYRVYIN